MELGNIISGLTIPDTENSAAYATRVALACENCRSCGIAIANCTEHKLVNPRSHVHAGRIVSRPAVIGPNCTGLIAAEKTYGSSWGAVGVISYCIKGTNKRIQIYYDVPMQRLLFNVQANVMVGFKTASKDLFEEMDKNLYGELTLARCTMRSVMNVEGFDIDFLMEDVEKSPLTVYLRPHEENDQQCIGICNPQPKLTSDRVHVID